MSLEKIIGRLSAITKDFQQGKEGLCTASALAEDAGLSRSTVSHCLNEETRKGSLIKIKRRPVFFLHRKTFEENFFAVEKNEFDSLRQLFSQSACADPLRRIVGADGSLQEAIEQIRTAVLYPNGGLSIMITGPTGSGKTHMASCICDYCRTLNLIARDAPFLSLNCAQYYHNPELLSGILFGCVKGAFTGADRTTDGLLGNADGGVLFLDEVHRLGREGQEKLFTFMDSGTWSRIGESGVRHASKVRLVFATTEPLSSTFLPTFLRRIPVVVNMPGFSERPLGEKFRLIDGFFLEESRILGKSLTASGKILSCLTSGAPGGNLGKIKNAVKYSCGRAYTKCTDRKSVQEPVRVTIQDMPKEILELFMKSSLDVSNAVEERLYDYRNPVLSGMETPAAENIRQTYLALEGLFGQHRNGELAQDGLFRRATELVNVLLDRLVFDQPEAIDNTAFLFVSHHIRSTFEYMDRNHNLKYDGNKVLALTYLFYFKNVAPRGETAFRRGGSDAFISDFIGSFMIEEARIAEALISLIKSGLDIEVSEMDRLFICLYLRGTDIRSARSRIRAVILAHGYSTAGSIASVANRMLGKNLFDAIDMSLDTTVDDIEKMLLGYAERQVIENALVLLVDMGSLTQINKRIKNRINVPVLTIDNVSTRVALAVGEMVLQECDIRTIHDRIPETLAYSRELVYPDRKKNRAVLTCCYTSLGTAVRIRKILEDGFGTALGLDVIPCNFNRLFEQKQEDMLFRVYDVLAIVGTKSPEIEGVPYISLESLILGDRIGVLTDLLKKYYTFDEAAIRRKLLLDFSLEQVIQNLTILEPGKVLLNVDESIGRIERNLNLEIGGTQKILLYIHIGCMIERILRKENVDAQPDILDYIEGSRNLFCGVRSGLKNIETKYHIEIGDCEVRLVCDIIRGDRAVAESGWKLQADL